jgi:DNA repair protein RadC
MRRILVNCLESQKPFPVYINSSSKKGQMKTPEEVYRAMKEIVEREQREVFVAFLLNTKNRIKRVHVISVGSLNASIVHPREILKPAIKHSAASIILAHNHPTGDPEPSREDIEFSMRMYRCGQLIGIELLDHLVVGEDSFVSMKERAMFDECEAPF